MRVIQYSCSGLNSPAEIMTAVNIYVTDDNIIP